MGYQNKLKNFFQKTFLFQLKRIFSPKIHISFSQSGEDLIVARILGRLGIARPTYLDIGANDPKVLNNTYLFYSLGFRGVLVEPNALLSDQLRRQRPGDCVLNVGVTNAAQVQREKLYIMANNVLSTFDPDEVAQLEKVNGNKVAHVVDVEMLNINQLIERHCCGCPNFINLDVEGMDLKILKSLDFVHFRPEVICVETIKCFPGEKSSKRSDVIDFMLSQGYMNFADTYINTIFVDSRKWAERSCE